MELQFWNNTKILTRQSHFWQVSQADPFIPACKEQHEQITGQTRLTGQQGIFSLNVELLNEYDSAWRGSPCLNK